MPHHKLVLVEGTYLLMDAPPWRDAWPLYDERWFIDVALPTAMTRMMQRHVQFGASPGLAALRTERNDSRNAIAAMATKANAHVVIPSMTT